MPRKPYPVVVTWVDSAHNRGWNSIQEKLEGMGPVTVDSVGYVIESSTAGLKLVMSLCGRDCADGLSIPRGCVKRVRRIRPR